MSGLLIETKKKIGSFKNTKKITKAMELVAASKMRYFQKKAVASRAFAWDLIDILKRNGEIDNSSIYMEERKEGKTVFVLFTSDKGLCGALNSKLTKALFNSKEWNDTPEKDRLLLTIGKKSYDFAKFNGIPVEAKFVGLKEKMTPIDALEVIEPILKYWTEENVKNIIMVAPHYKNAFTYYPIVKSFLPLTPKNLTEHIGKEKELAEVKEDITTRSKNDYMIYEPGHEAVIEQLTENLVETLFIQAFFELKAAEYSSRMIAMKNATDNTDKIIEELTLDLNKARQQVITSELADLVNAAEAVQ